jgi:hypothetical protein
VDEWLGLAPWKSPGSSLCEIRRSLNSIDLLEGLVKLRAWHARYVRRIRERFIP